VVAHKAKKAPVFELEYTTFRTDVLRPKNGTQAEVAGAGGVIYPIPPSHLPRSLRPGGDAHGKTKRTPYAMQDLTVSSWLKLARTLGNTTEEKMRARFRTFMTVSAGGEVEG
jgi:endopolyphosphatase